MSQHNSTQDSSHRVSLRAPAVMEITGHRNRSAFWQFVHTSGVPHIRLNRRNIVFDQAALNCWLAARTVGGAA